jgi:hypothetical protein
MVEHFEFADAWWFRGPLRLVTLAVIVFSLLSLYPALIDRANPDHVRAIWGMAVLGVFVLGAVAFMASISDSYIEIEDGILTIRFESFFGARIPVEHITSVSPLASQPRWSHRWGLSTNWRDRIACSHGGKIIEIELSVPYEVKLWPRAVHVTRFWLAPRDYGAFLTALERTRSVALVDDERRAA